MRLLILLLLAALALASCSDHVMEAKVKPVDSEVYSGLHPLQITQLSDMFEIGDTIMLSSAPYVIVDIAKTGK